MCPLCFRAYCPACPGHLRCKVWASRHSRAGPADAARVASSYGREIFDVQYRREGQGMMLRCSSTGRGGRHRRRERQRRRLRACQSRFERDFRCRGCRPGRVHSRGLVARTGSASPARRGLPAVRRASRQDRDAGASGRSGVLQGPSRRAGGRRRADRRRRWAFASGAVRGDRPGESGSRVLAAGRALTAES